MHLRVTVGWETSILAAYPMLRFNEDYADLVKGGFDVGHLLNCGLEKYQTADVILVHYEEFSAKGSARWVSTFILNHRHLLRCGYRRANVVCIC
jgi:hypothetical protein